MELKDYLSTDLKNRFFHETSEALQILEEINLEEADYIVTVKSLLPNEKTVSRQHHGSMEETIHRAGSEFMRLNNRNNTRAEWSVQIKLGAIIYEIPKEFWHKYIGLG